MGLGVDALRGASGGAEPSAEPPQPPRSGVGSSDSVLIILAVAAVVALGIGFRFFTRSNLWADEALTVNIAQLPLSQLSHALRQDGAPPLYYVLLHLWMRAFGSSDAGARGLSGVFGVLTLIPAWFAGRRLDERRIRAGRQEPGTRTVAWALVLLLAVSPFAIRYSTEVRMYSLVMLLVFLGYLAVMRLIERFTVTRFLCVAVIAALLLYTHYWALGLLATTGVVLAAVGLRGPLGLRRNAWITIGAIAVGSLAFLPWVPNFLYQVHHTGTPWGAPVSLTGSPAEALGAFGGNVHVVGWALLMMALLAVFALGIDRRHLAVDLWSVRGVRLEAGLAAGILAVGLAIARLSGTTFEGRYASTMFPLFLMVAAFGVTVFVSKPVRYGVLVLLVLVGLWGGASNAFRNRTQAFQSANAIKAGARAGDLVVYCPDSIGTDVSRLIPSDLKQVSFPSMHAPGRINWVDYKQRVEHTNPVAFAQSLNQRAGRDHNIWFVYEPGQPIVDQPCNKVADALTFLRGQRTQLVEPDTYFFEHQGLYRYPAA
jgi:hypothetical protein